MKLKWADHRWKLFLFFLVVTSVGVAAEQPFEKPEYKVLKGRLVRHWNTWDSRNVLEQVSLPSGFAFNVEFKQFNWIGADVLSRALIGRGGEDVEQVRPGLHSLDGSYTELQLRWQKVDAVIETGHDGDDAVVLITPKMAAGPPASIIIGASFLWNRPGTVHRDGSVLVGEAPGTKIKVFTTAAVIEDPYVPARTPYLVGKLEGPVGISTGKPRTTAQIRSILDARKREMMTRAESQRELAKTYVAVQSGIAWNTIYEPKFDRVISTVGRLWNEEYGGYCLFGWDNFFLAYMTGLYSRDLAYANFIEHLRSMTEEGFIPNDDRGNGTKSWDHSQPPVGSIMLREIYRKYPERWLLETSFDDLLKWNRWWVKARMNGGLLSYGSHNSQNPYGQKSVHTKTTAGYESGMDDSPMYSGVPFNADKNVLELQDVGLNSLYIADCDALAEIAQVLGRNTERDELRTRAAEIRRTMESLWSELTGLYLNKRTDTGEFSTRLSPTHFYPLLARLPEAQRASRMLEHFWNKDEFYGEFLLPSIARNDPDFPKQRYWKGAIWPPLNFLVYLGLRNYGQKDAARELATKSRALFEGEWERKGYVSENYSALTGTGDDQRLSSDQFHSWGALMGFISFIEAGQMPAPEKPLAGAAK